MGKEVELCAACRYWDQCPGENHKDTGRCRRRSPNNFRTVFDDEKFRWSVADWPMTDGSDWCGEFKRAAGMADGPQIHSN